MDREALVRASRRRHALDALAFEQDRAAVLASQLEDVLAEADGAGLDAALFAQLSPDDAALVRTALGEDLGAETDEPDVSGDDPDSSFDEDEAVADAGESDAAEDEESGVEEEIARLEGELELSRRVQAALERYVALLSDRPGG